MNLTGCQGKNIHWDLTPQKAAIEGEVSTLEEFERIREQLRAMAGAYFYIDVWNCQARLALIEQNEHGTGRAATIEQVLIDDAEMQQAISDQGGMINLSGHYALPLPLQERIRTYLEQGLVKCASCARAFRILQEACRELSAADIQAGKWLCADCSEEKEEEE